MIFNYKAIDKNGETKEGVIDAISMDVAISSLQKRDLIISSIVPQDESQSFLQHIPFLNRVSNKEVVILSRQLATLFEAQVSALRIFKLMSSEVENPQLRKSLTEIADDLQGGSSISKALAKHPNVFSPFYINLVKAGEESGRLNETFNYLADYLDRTYEVTSKAKNALIYPAFVIVTFIGVMILMFTVIIPKISSILTDSGQALPIYTQIVLDVSSFFVHYGVFLLVAVVIGALALWRFAMTPEGQLSLSSFKLSVPYVGDLYKKLYLSRIADNLHTMIVSGIPMLRSLEITANVVGNDIYKQILEQSLTAVKGGSSLSSSLSQYPEIPGILVQMVKVGEETGQLGKILKTLASFYQREVMNAVDTLVGLIEPVMIVVLGLGVGILLASVLMPIYNVASTFGS
ncbi:MAG TPA: type II secretion system F family protein [Candidatus Paceibacterota bacterium]|jgi:type IV pilus assembly protein PilC|nr:type II secretion system F family protein [Candidatus Paceibacterota bacterium]